MVTVLPKNYLDPNDPQNQQMVNFANINNPVPSPKFSVSIPDTIPTEAVSSSATPSQVLTTRDNKEAAQVTLSGIQNTLQGINSYLSTASDPFSNPQGFLQSTFNSDPTRAETLRQSILDDVAARTREFGEGQAGAARRAYRQAGVGQASDQLSGIQEQIGARQVQQREDLRAFGTDPRLRGMARSFADDKEQRVTADANAELADLAIQEIAASGRYDRALEMAKTDIQQQLDAFNMEIGAYQADLAALEPTLEGEQKEQAMQQQIALQQLKQQTEQQAENQLAIREIGMEAIMQGADQEAAQAILNATTPEEALENAVGWLGRLDRMQVQASLNKIYSGLSASNDPNVAGTALGAVSFRLPENQREDLFRQMDSAIRSGDVEAVDRILRGAAQQAAGTTIAGEVIGRDGAITSLRNLKSDLNEYVAAGGSTDIITGGWENIQNKLGQTQDPKLAALEVQIRTSIQAYRKAVSGAAFTESETKEYERIWPQISNDTQLNNARLDQLINSFEANNGSFYNNFYPDSVSNMAEAAVLQYFESQMTPEQLAAEGVTQ